MFFILSSSFGFSLYQSSSTSVSPHFIEIGVNFVNKSRLSILGIFIIKGSAGIIAPRSIEKAGIGIFKS